MIHFSRLGMLMERKDGQNRRVSFSMKFCKQETGEIVTVNEAVCTSSYYHNSTCNIMFLPSLQVRTIHKLSIIEFNGQEVYL